MAEGFGGFGGFDGGFPYSAPPKATPKPKKKEEKGLPWAAKKFDGKYYVPLEQVVELLKQNDVLPTVRRGLEHRIHALEAQKDLDGI